MISKTVITIFSIVAVAFAYALYNLQIAETLISEKEVTVTNRGLTSNLPLYVALEKEFFKEQNLKIKLINVSSGTQVYDYLVGGLADVGQLPIEPIMLNEVGPETDVKIFLVARYSDTKNLNFDSILLRNDSSITSLKDLEGKRVGIFPGITSQILLRHYLRSNGVNDDVVNLVSLEPVNQLEFLNSGTVDALWAYQPVAGIGLNNGFKELDNSVINKIGPDYYSVYAFSRDFLESEPDAADKFYSAMSKAASYMESNEFESRQIMGEYTPLRDLALQIDYFPYYKTISDEDVENLEALIEFYKSQGLIPSLEDPRYIVFEP